jgi:Mrp family chromosome partitioning ATPase
LGISDYLFNDARLEDILFSPSIDRLVVLPGRESIHNSSEMLRSPKMVELVAELKGRYTDRLIIFDLPPVLAIDDAIAFKPYTDALLLVAENGATKREDMATTLELLKGTPIIGTVLNKSEHVNTSVYTRE